MRILETKVYTFDELTNQAKEKARDWYRDGDDSQWAWESVQEDAQEIGLKLISLSDSRSNEGSFIGSAVETLKQIKENHGKSCETYLTAVRYEKALTENPDGEDSAHEFLHDLLEDYRVMLNKEIEYQNSDESVDESIRANEYEFTETGKRI
jgi:hypothetical protein